MPLLNPYADTLPDVVTPWDYDLVAWNWEPTNGSPTLTTRLNTAGRLNVHTIAVPIPITVTNVHVHITATPTALTSGQCGVALYSGTTLLGSLVTGVDTAWASLGFKTHAMSGGPFKIAAGTLLQVALWYNGTTSPGLFRSTSAQTDTSLALSAANFRDALADTGRTTSAPSTLGTKTGSASIPHWVGLS